MINTRKLRLLSVFSLLIISFATRCVGPLALFGGKKVAAQQMDTALPNTDSQHKKARMRKTAGEKKKKEKKIHTYRDMNYDQLLLAKNEQIASKNIISAIKYLDQLMKLCTDVTKIGAHLLEIADLLFEDEQYEKAARLYAEFSMLYPGSERKEYALYRSIVSSFSCLLSSDRDQTKTEETLVLVEVFLSQDIFTTHRDEVLQIRSACHEKLIESEFSVCEFHLSRGRFIAANKRLERIRTIWLPKKPMIELQLLTLEADCAEKKEAFAVAQQKRAEAAQKAMEIAMLDTPKHKKMVERF